MQELYGRVHRSSIEFILPGCQHYVPCKKYGPSRPKAAKIWSSTYLNGTMHPWPSNFKAGNGWKWRPKSRADCFFLIFLGSIEGIPCLFFKGGIHYRLITWSLDDFGVFLDGFNHRTAGGNIPDDLQSFALRAAAAAKNRAVWRPVGRLKGSSRVVNTPSPDTASWPKKL